MTEKLDKLAQTIKESLDVHEKGYQEVTHYSLDGRVLKADGSITRTDYFKFLDIPLDNYDDIVLTKDEAETFRRHVQAMSTGLQAMVPLICPGEVACKFSERCPMVKIGKVPVGRSCIPELELITFWRKRYIEEFEINPHSITELGMANELAELDIYDMRTSIVLSKEDAQDLTQNDEVGATNSGDRLLQKRVHTAWEIKERIKVRRLKILESLVGTRKEKYKRAAALKTRDVGDPSSSMSNMRSKLEALNDEMNMVKSEDATDITPEGVNPYEDLPAEDDGAPF